MRILYDSRKENKFLLTKRVGYFDVKNILIVSMCSKVVHSNAGSLLREVEMDASPNILRVRCWALLLCPPHVKDMPSFRYEYRQCYQNNFTIESLRNISNVVSVRKVRPISACQFKLVLQSSSPQWTTRILFLWPPYTFWPPNSTTSYATITDRWSSIDWSTCTNSTTANRWSCPVLTSTRWTSSTIGSTWCFISGAAKRRALLCSIKIYKVWFSENFTIVFFILVCFQTICRIGTTMITRHKCWRVIGGKICLAVLKVKLRL